jgi:hypothetical protein
MTMRELLLLVGSSILGYVVLLLVELVWSPPAGTNIFFIALGGAFAGGFGYWYPEHRRRQTRSPG